MNAFARECVEEDAHLLVRGGFSDRAHMEAFLDVALEDEGFSGDRRAVVREILDREIQALRRDQEAWPEETDCDRLDRAFDRLKSSGILARQHYLCCDNCATHKTPAVKRWLARHREYHLHFTPTSASWLNQVERVFADLTTKQLRRGVFKSVAALEAAALAYLDERNSNARPFAWTADAQTILGRVAKNRAGISESGH